MDSQSIVESIAQSTPGAPYEPAVCAANKASQPPNAACAALVGAD